MGDLKAFVDDIQTKLAAIPADQLIAPSTEGMPDETKALMALNVGDLSKRFEALVGPEKVGAFYRDVEPANVATSFHLFPTLWRYLSDCIESTAEGGFAVCRARLLEELTTLADGVLAGQLDYSFAMRLINIDIVEDFDLENGVAFRKLSPDDIKWKYPIDRQFTPVSQLTERYLPNHCVEVIIRGRGTPADIQRDSGVVSADARINSILTPFVLANIPRCQPSVTHVLIDCPIERSCLHRGVGALSFEPHLLVPIEIATFKDRYNFFVNDVPKDRVLRTAVDRFVVGRKRSEYHPNRINEPNWDKVVDYAIAMETLFVTVNGQPMDSELSYRFRLNGASLIHHATGDSLKRTFHALKSLYTLRSKVVHGGEEKAILKNADEFIGQLKIDCPNHKHSLGRLMLVSRKTEEWITRVFSHLQRIPESDRPYRKRDGWEEMLWQERLPT
jgi:hypothetical protein